MRKEEEEVEGKERSYFEIGVRRWTVNSSTSISFLHVSLPGMKGEFQAKVLGAVTHTALS